MRAKQPLRHVLLFVRPKTQKNYSRKQSKIISQKQKSQSIDEQVANSMCLIFISCCPVDSLYYVFHQSFLRRDSCLDIDMRIWKKFATQWLLTIFVFWPQAYRLESYGVFEESHGEYEYLLVITHIWG